MSKGYIVHVARVQEIDGEKVENPIGVFATHADTPEQAAENAKNYYGVARDKDIVTSVV